MSEPEAAATEGEETSQFPCANCGAKLDYRPGTDHLACAWCGHENKIAGNGNIVAEIDFHAELERLEGLDEHEQQTTAKCDTCAAEVEKRESQTALECPFCGASIVGQGQARRRIRPRSLLPFKIARAAASASFAKWIGSLWFAPRGLKKYARSESRLRGLYMPYWTFDAETDSRYTGQRGEHYYVTVSYTATENGKSVQRTRQEQRTRWYPASGRVEDDFDDVLIAASRVLPPALLRELEPWDVEALEPYADSWLAGFEAEAYQVGLEEGFGEAKTKMEEGIRESVRQDIGGDEQRIFSVHTDWQDITFKHILLPVWVSAYRFRAKVYRFLVNARTGEVRGERPWSALKITLVVLFGLALIGAIVWFANR